MEGKFWVVEMVGLGGQHQVELAFPGQTEKDVLDCAAITLNYNYILRENIVGLYGTSTLI